jgi:hypothetical protein
MGEIVVTEEMLAAKFTAILSHLDERQRRLVLAADARMLGHGGIRQVALAAGVREATVSLGVSELEAGAGPLGRVRRPGRRAQAGRRPGPGAGPGAAGTGGAGRAGRPAVAFALDGEIDPHAGGRADRAGP